MAPGPTTLQGNVPGVGYSARGQGVRQSVCVGVRLWVEGKSRVREVQLGCSVLVGENAEFIMQQMIWRDW